MRALLTCALLLAACGSSSTPSTTPTPPDQGSAEVAVVLPDVPFDQLSPEQKSEFMKQKVVPAMKPIFQKHDAEEFKEFGCKTCHGAGAEKGELVMPNPALPVLDFKNMSEWEPEDLTWMGEDVKPTMAKLLGEQEMTKDNPAGFGCLGCHTMKP